MTSIQSAPIALPAGAQNLTLTFSSYLANGSNSSTADYLRVRVVTSEANTIVYQRLGSASNVNGAWLTSSASLQAFAGQTVQLRIEAADLSTASLVEAGVDELARAAHEAGSDELALAAVRVALGGEHRPQCRVAERGGERGHGERIPPGGLRAQGAGWPSEERCAVAVGAVGPTVTRAGSSG